VETSAPWSGRLRQAGGSLLRSQQIGLVVVLLLLGAALSASAGSHPDRVTGAPVNNFLNAYTLIQMATDASAFAIMGVGMTVVIISGGIDLSVGAIYALSGVTMAMVLRALPALPPGCRWSSASGPACP
jgi:ribose transport system permease protein